MVRSESVGGSDGDSEEVDDWDEVSVFWGFAAGSSRESSSEVMANDG